MKIDRTLKEEGRGKKEEGRGKKEEGRGKKEEGRGKKEKRKTFRLLGNPVSLRKRVSRCYTFLVEAS
ncbi:MULTISPECIES: hypothetical protein [unclassified Microcoleus]|uniref:hypothetical protein n=1 Tax=unclassified Microcoleus TaxID=2642155 RepID=UPI002FD6804B